MTQIGVIDPVETPEGLRYDTIVYDSEAGTLFYPPFAERVEGLAFLQAHAIHRVGTYEALAAQLRLDGYRLPSEHDLDTDYLCTCGTELRLDPQSRGAGHNAPYGALIHVYYHCPSCKASYCRERQERQYGWSSEWSYREAGAGRYTDCEEPIGRPTHNPYGYREARLHRANRKEGGE